MELVTEPRTDSLGLSALGADILIVFGGLLSWKGEIYLCL